MRLLLVGPNIYEKNKLGGIITVVNQILSRINDIDYFARSPQVNKISILNFVNLILIFFRFNSITKKDYDTIHINTALENTALIRDLILCRIAKKNKKKIILHIHGGKYFSFPPTKRKKDIIQSMLNCADKIIVLSKKEKSEIQDKYKIENVDILENSIEIPKIENALKKSFHTLNFIYLGRIAPNKGLEDILDALLILKEEKIKFTYKLYGNGPILNGYKDLCESILGDSFTYGGVVFNENKWKVYLESNIFLLPSLFEGLPMSLLEAMATGNICITTKVGSIPEVINDKTNGYFVEKQSPRDIADISKSILQNKKNAEEISKNAYDTVSNFFNLDKYIEKLNKIYNSI